MTDVAIRELRNHTRQVLERVDGGEVLTITVDGRPTAQLVPLPSRPRFLDRQAFVSQVLAHQADPALRADLADLAPDTTDDVLW